MPMPNLINRRSRRARQMAELAAMVEERGEELLGETGSAADWAAAAGAAASPAALAECLRRLEGRIALFGDGLPRGAAPCRGWCGLG